MKIFFLVSFLALLCTRNVFGVTSISSPQNTQTSKNGNGFNTIKQNKDDKDREAPTTPTNLSAQIINSTQITLHWSASTDNQKIKGYYIWRGNEQIGQGEETVFSDPGLTPKTIYRYYVQAVDDSGNRSFNSEIVALQTPEGTGEPSGSVDLAPPELVAVHAPTGHLLEDVKNVTVKMGESYSLRGKSKSGSTVILTIYSRALVFKIAANKEGDWEFEIPAALEIGYHKVEVETVDQDGHRSPKAELLTFRVVETSRWSQVLPYPKTAFLVLGLVITGVVSFIAYRRKQIIKNFLDRHWENL